MGSISNLNEADIRIITIFDRDQIQFTKQDNEKLREKLRQFKAVDLKKSEELKVKNICAKMTFVQNLASLNYYFKRRAAYHFKAYEYRNWRAFEFFQSLNKNMFKGILFINLNRLIGGFTFRNSNVDLTI